MSLPRERATSVRRPRRCMQDAAAYRPGLSGRGGGPTADDVLFLHPSLPTVITSLAWHRGERVVVKLYASRCTPAYHRPRQGGSLAVDAVDLRVERGRALSAGAGLALPRRSASTAKRSLPRQVPGRALAVAGVHGDVQAGEPDRLARLQESRPRRPASRSAPGGDAPLPAGRRSASRAAQAAGRGHGCRAGHSAPPRSLSAPQVQADPPAACWRQARAGQPGQPLLAVRLAEGMKDWCAWWNRTRAPAAPTRCARAAEHDRSPAAPGTPAPAPAGSSIPSRPGPGASA